MKRASPLHTNPDAFNQLLEIGQDPSLSYRQIIKQIPNITHSQIQWAIHKGQIPKRSNEAVINKLIEVGKDPSLSYKDIMELVPVTHSQIRHAIEKGQIPKRSLDPERLRHINMMGGLRGAMIRWGYTDDDR